MTHEEETFPGKEELTAEEELESSLRGLAQDTGIPEEMSDNFVGFLRSAIGMFGEADDKKRAEAREEFKHALGQLAERRGFSGEYRDGFVNDVFNRFDSIREQAQAEEEPATTRQIIPESSTE